MEVQRNGRQESLERQTETEAEAESERRRPGPRPTRLDKKRLQELGPTQRLARCSPGGMYLGSKQKTREHRRWRGLLQALATAELERQDTHYLQSSRQVAFLGPDWDLAEALAEAGGWWDSRAVQGVQRGLRGWAGSAGSNKPTEVIICMDVNRHSTINHAVWQIAWMDVENRRLVVSWSKEDEPQARDTGWARLLIKGLNSEGTEARWRIRWQGNGRPNWPRAELLLWHAAQIWRYWRFGGDRAAQDSPVNSARVATWWDRCIAGPSQQDLTPENIKCCFRGPTQDGVLPRQAMVKEDTHPPLTLGSWWDIRERSNWQGEWTHLASRPAEERQHYSRICCWNVDGWNDQLQEHLWTELVEGQVDAIALQDHRWTPTAAHNARGRARSEKWGDFQMRWNWAHPPDNEALDQGHAPRAGGTALLLHDNLGARQRLTGRDPTGWGRYVWSELQGRNGCGLLLVTVYAATPGGALAARQQAGLAAQGKPDITPLQQLLSDLRDLIGERRHDRLEIVIMGDFNYDASKKQHGGLTDPAWAPWRTFLDETRLCVSSVDRQGQPLLTYDHPSTPGTAIDKVLMSERLHDIARVGVIGGQARIPYKSAHCPIIVEIPVTAVLQLHPEDLLERQHRAARPPRRLKRRDARRVEKYQAALSGTQARAGGSANRQADAVRPQPTPALWPSYMATQIEKMQRLVANAEAGARDPDSALPRHNGELQRTMDLVMDTAVTALLAAQARAVHNNRDGATRRIPDGWSPHALRLGRALRQANSIIGAVKAGRKWREVQNAGSALLAQLNTEPAQPGYLEQWSEPNLVTPLTDIPAPTSTDSDKRRWVAHLFALRQGLRRALQGDCRKRQRISLSARLRAREGERRAGRQRRYLDSVLGRPAREPPPRVLALPAGQGRPPAVLTASGEVQRALVQEFKSWFGHGRTRWWETHTNATLWADSREGRRMRKAAAEGTLTPVEAGLVGELAEILPHLKRKQLPDGRVISEEDHAGLLADVSMEQMLEELKPKHSEVASGASGLHAELILCAPVEIQEAFRIMVNCTLRSGHMYTRWKRQLLRPTPKKPGAIAIDQMRPIMLLELLRKLAGGVLSRRYMANLRRVQALEPNLNGAIAGGSTEGPVMSLTMAIEDAAQYFKELHVALLDVSRAFDSGERTMVIEMALRRTGAPEAFISNRCNWENWTYTEVLSWFGRSSMQAGGVFRTETGTAQGESEAAPGFALVVDIILALLKRRATIANNAYWVEGEHADIPLVCHCYADDLLPLSDSLQGLQRTVDGIVICAHVFGWKLSIPKCVYVRVAPRRTPGGKIEFPEPVGEEDIRIKTPWIAEDPGQAIQRQPADVAFRNLGVMQDLRGDGGDQISVTQAKIAEGVAQLKARRMTADGTVAAINMVLRRQAMYPLRLTACDRADVEMIERPARQLLLQRLSIASTTSRALTEMNKAAGGLGYLSWWDELHMDQFSYLYRHLDQETQAGQLMRAAEWRLRRAIGHNRCPFNVTPEQASEEGYTRTWLSGLIRWMREMQLYLRDGLTLPPPARLLNEGPPHAGAVNPAEHAQIASKLELIDGTDWIRATGPQSFELRREVVSTATDATVEEDTETQWLRDMLPGARSWLERLNAAWAEAGCSTQDIPLRPRAILTWEVHPGGGDPGAEENTERRRSQWQLGSVLVRDSTRILLALFEESSPAGLRPCTRAGSRVRQYRLRLPPATVWVPREQLYSTPAYETDWRQERLNGEAYEIALPRGFQHPEEWRRLSPTAPSAILHLPIGGELPLLGPLGPSPGPSSEQHELQTLQTELATAHLQAEQVVARREAAGVRPTDFSRAHQLARIRLREVQARLALAVERAPGPREQPEVGAPEPQLRHCYGDGSCDWVGEELHASYAALETDDEEGTSWVTGGRVISHPTYVGVDRGEIRAVLDLVVHNSVSKGAMGKMIAHIDRAEVVSKWALLGEVDLRTSMNWNCRDLWEALATWKRHLGERFAVVKVKAHMDRGQRGVEMTRHHRGNQQADQHAKRQLRAAPTPEECTSESALINGYRSSRWRITDGTGRELTGPVKAEVRALCQQAATRRDCADRQRANRPPRPRMDSWIGKWLNTKLTTEGKCTGPTEEEVDGWQGEGVPIQGSGGGAPGVGGGYRQGQLFKFLHGRLPTQHILEERANGAHLPCALCHADAPADNGHMLFRCKHPDMVKARGVWAVMVQRAWEDARLPETFKRDAGAFWTLAPGETEMGLPTGAHLRDTHPILLAARQQEGRADIGDGKRIEEIQRGWWDETWRITAYRAGEGNYRMAEIINALATVGAVVRTQWREVWKTHNRLTHSAAVGGSVRNAKEMYARWKQMVKAVKEMKRNVEGRGYCTDHRVREAIEGQGKVGLSEMESWICDNRLPILARKGSLEELTGGSVPVTRGSGRGKQRQGRGTRQARGKKGRRDDGDGEVKSVQTPEDLPQGPQSSMLRNWLMSREVRKEGL